MAGEYNFTIKQGADFSRVFTWKDENGAAIDLTGYDALLHLKRKYSDVSPTHEWTVSSGHLALGGAAGTITLTVPDTETGDMTSDYLYDLQMISGGGLKTDLLYGLITIQKTAI